MHNFYRCFRRATGLGIVAMLAVPLAAQAADYRAQFSESFNTGLAAARPAMTLTALIDNGSGGVPVATGVVRFNVDTRHLTPSAWASMLAAPAGTQLGTVTNNLTGTSSLRVLSHGTDAFGQYVRAGIDVPGGVASIIGDDNLVFVIRRTPSHAHLTYVLDLRPAVGKLVARGAASTLQMMTLAVRSSIIYGGKSRGIAINPTSVTAITNSVTARACAALPVLAELALPLLEPGGQLLAWKGPLRDDDLEVRAGNAVSPLLGGGALRLLDAGHAALGGHRFVIIDKLTATPPRFPRRSGEPARRPLG